MEPTIIALVVFSSLLHSTWHSLVKISGNRLITYSLINIFAAIIAGTYIIFDPFITKSALPYLALSSLIHLAYKIVLIKAYEAKDFSVIFPISRGSAPVFILIISIIYLGIDIIPIKLFLVLFIGVLICLLALPSIQKGEASARNVYYACTTGLITALYSLVDGYGGRISENPITFICWMYVIDAMIFPPYTYLKYKKEFRSLVREYWGRSLVAALFSVISYAIVVFAMSKISIAEIAAIREINIVFAALISYFFLKEKITPYKLGIIVAITLCVSILSYYR